MKKPIGMVIKTIIEEKGLKAQEVAKRIGLTRQSIYQLNGKVEMSEGEIRRWANALEVSYEEILSRREEKNGVESAPSDILSKQISRIEKMFQEQIEVKDKQIQTLTELLTTSQNTIQQLLGKSEGVPRKPGVPFLLLPGCEIDTSGYTRGYAKA